eukprot:GHUV01005756.1.p1 GENE.GHUV01005756.1~~GHUV01005756.1.p1  ORF type:complete len:398 (+),score=76.15 GHUV01005756.1:661-1854(+)
MSAPLTGVNSQKDSKLGGWLGSMKANGVHRRTPSPDVIKDQLIKNDADYQSLWSPDVAAAMGYGKGGRSGSAFQWFILLSSAALAFGSFIAWCVFVFRARDATDAAVSAARLDLEVWRALKGIILATAICYPIFAVLAIAVSLWRAYLARQLNIHAPNTRWMKNCKWWQAANFISSHLLYGMFILMVFSIAAHALWAYTARAAQYGSYYAIKYVDPVWSGVTNVVNASESLVNDFVSLAQQIPGGRRLTGFDPVSGRPIILRQLAQEDVDVMPQSVIDAGVAAARSLQQVGDLTNALGGALSGIAGAIGAVPTGQLNSAVGGLTQNLAQLPGLSQILPNGADNPLFRTLSGVTNAVESQVLNRTGCPIYCVDLRDQKWIQDGCMCNLQRVKVRLWQQ